MRAMTVTVLLTMLAACGARIARADDPATDARQESAQGIRHSFLALGAETYIMSEDGHVVRRFPEGTRDGWVLPNGDLLLAITKSDKFPHGAAVEITPDGKELFHIEGTQSEVNTVEALGNGHYLLTEAGPHPSLLEVDRAGKVLVDVPLQAQTRDTHLQTRMSRKLADGNYLVPQLLDKVVRAYTPQGKVAWEAHTPDDPPECWPFTAIRLPDGHTLATCTHGKTVVEFDAAGHVAWQLSNADLPEPLLQDPCGAQRLPNGNTVIASYGESRPGHVKLLEVTRDRKLVWTYRDNKNHGIHELQILTTNSKPIDGPPMK